MSEAAPRTLSWWKTALLSIGGGVLTGMAFPPFDISGLVWVGLLPLLTALWLGPAKKRRGFMMGWLFGMGFFSTCFHWIVQVGIVWEIPTPLFLCVAFIPLMAFYSILPGIWGMFAATMLRPALQAAPEIKDPTPDKVKESWSLWRFADMASTLRCAIGLGALWVCIEWLRANGALACSLNGLGLALYHGLSMAQWAEFVGTDALSFLPVATSVILWCAGRRVWMNFHGTHKICRPWDFYGAVILLFLLFMGGLAISKAYSPAAMLEREGVMRLPVVSIQLNRDQAERIRKTITLQDCTIADSLAYRRQLTTDCLLGTEQAFRSIQEDTFKLALKNPGQDVQQQLPVWVVWPESALGMPLWKAGEAGQYIASEDTLTFLDDLATLRDTVGEMGGQRFVLLTGADEYLVDSEREAGCDMLNSIVCFPDDPEDIRSAAKQHLMPFGEYLPLVEQVEWIGKVYSQITGTQVGDGIRPGKGTEPLTLPVPGTQETVQAIPAVCYEDTDAALLRQFVRPGAQVIVNDTNDAWFRDSVCGMQQARSAAFRCIELRRPMVRAANKGVCCSIAPNGGFIDVLQTADGDPHTAGYSYAILPVDRKAGLTIYAMFGDWAVILCLLLGIGLAVPGLKCFRKP